MSGKYIQTVLIIAATSLTIVACATSETEPDAQHVYNFEDKDKDEVICRRQRTFGSHVTKVVCRTRGQIEEDQRAAMEMLGPLRPMGGDEPRRPPE